MKHPFPIRIRTAATFVTGLLFFFSIARAVPFIEESQRTPADQVIEEHHDGVHALAFFPDGSRFVSASHDATVKVWESKTGHLVRNITGHDGPVFCVAVSPDGKWIATGGHDHTVRVWDANTWEQIAQLEGHTGDVHGVAFLPDGRLVSGAGDGIRAWDVAGEKLLWKWRGESDKSVMQMSVTADGKRLALIDGYVGSCIVLNLDKHTQIGHYGSREHWPVYVAISPDGSNLFVSDGSIGGVGHYDIATKKSIVVPRGWEFTQARSMIFSADGKRVIIGWKNAEVEVWDLEGGELKQSMRRSSKLRVGAPSPDSLAVSPDGKTLLVGGGGTQTLTGWQVSTENPISRYPLGDEWLKRKLGVARGPISWDELPVRIKTLDGEKMNYVDWLLRREPGAMVSGAQMRSIVDGLDVWLWNRVILFHRGGGLMEEILVDDAASFQDIAWDGSHIWLSSANSGIFILDITGRTIDRLEKLPACRQSLRLYTLAPGKMLVVGTDGKRSWPLDETWCAIIERKAPGQIETKVFLKASDHPVDWLVAPSANPEKGRTFSPAFAPVWLSEPPAGPAQRDRKILSLVRANDGYRMLSFDMDHLSAAVGDLPRSNDAPERPLQPTNSAPA